MLNELNIEKVKKSKEAVVLTVKVIANARNNAVEFQKDGSVKLRIAKIASDGRANKEIIKFLSEIFDVPKGNVEILKGEKSNHKNISIKPKP
jgi:uncharacterized protein (TIGR00251 family)